MRTRFTAFALGDAGYLLRSWHSATRPKAIDLDPRVRWVRLDVLNRTGGGLLDTEGTVDFVAFWKDGRRSGSQRENSRFVKEQGRWVYVGPAAGSQR